MTAQNMTDNKRTLLIGAQSPACTSISWPEIGQINLVDFDRLVLIARDLPQQMLKYHAMEIPAIKEKISRVLASGGELIVVTPRPATFPLRSSPDNPAQSDHDINSFLPFSVSFKDESGSTLTLNDNAQYRRYLTKINSWQFWFEGPAMAAKLEHLSNREGRMLAGCISVRGIKVTILPDLARLSNDEIAHEVLTELHIAVPDEPPPEWAEKVPMPRLSGINDDIDASEARIAQEEITLIELRQNRRDLAKYKRLLYAKGDELEAVVENILAQLGVELDDERHSVEDLLGKFEDESCVFEVTGTDGALKLLKVRQLFNHAFLVEETTGLRPKAILVANPLRKIPLEMRDKSNTPEFPSNVVARAEEMKIALVSGRWLFEKFCAVLEGNIKGEAVIREVLDTNGLVG